ncbi:MAG: hypothetical protein AAF740_03520 [Bacteroidota bacterium]
MQVFIIMLLAASTAFANPITDKDKDKKNPKTTEATVETTEEEGEEGIHCIVYKDGEQVAECWLCNCGKLYKAVHGTPKPKISNGDNNGG